MRVLLLEDPNSSHTIKWAKALARNDITILIFGLNSLLVSDYDNISNIEVKTLNQIVTGTSRFLIKLKYLRALPLLKKVIKNFNPDIVHAHYASSYGLLGALSGFHPFIISVWGSDVFDFPRTNLICKKVLKFNLRKADKILSTSHIMAKETNLYTNKNVEVTPFGIDLNQFKPMKVDSLFYKDDLVIGTIKTLEEKYGIEYLIRAFKIVCDKYTNLPLKLLIVGGGSLEYKLKKLTDELDIQNKTIFTGKVPFEDVPKYHNMLTVSVSVSNSESFGVAIIEASACSKPVIVSNVGGLPEVVESNVTGYIVPPKDSIKTAEAIEKLILDEIMRKQMGVNGRERVRKLYNWDDNVKQMINIYKDIINA
ncbi:MULTISPECIES: glycosyltransferase [unclassified Francisella]|uniref:glycosyltransferase n=1 Tax=unclassified Francisella TaxID=2610885 RepID=UPI002E33E375|nr:MULTISPECIES: glycosyltransferase [unclassified Francisella]MED7818621.1 glycosyltransferase [Francisella sp. 19S2-4]MED7829457.1 glycosyltransferase [Francisella sp. 19S2-10]